MDKVIQDIVSIDNTCSKAVEDAKKKKLDVQSNMSAKKKEIYDSFVKEYQVKIDEKKKELKAQIEDTKTKNEEEYNTSLSQLSNLYADNKDQWIQSIVERCEEI